MRSLIRYLIKHHALVLFIILEAFALTLIFNHNSFQRTKYLNSANYITGSIYKIRQSVTGYFGLRKINRELVEENARLQAFVHSLNQLDEAETEINILPDFDDAAVQLIPARIINNSVNRPFNYITLNKGSKDGIRPDQGIISSMGVVGVIAGVSDSYSMGLSILNQRWSISAKLKKSGYFGALSWQGKNYRFATLNEIPLHVDVQQGDTIITSGYSAIFPEGVMIGTVDEISHIQGENYFEISVKLSVDFKSLNYVKVIELPDREERQQLLNSIEYDPKRN